MQTITSHYHLMDSSLSVGANTKRQVWVGRGLSPVALFTHVLFPTYIAAFLWGGLILRDERLRALLPVRRPS